MTQKAADIMTREVVTTTPDASLSEAAGILADHEISAMPVCDEAGRIVGMVSEGDLMRPFAQNQASKRSWWLGMFAEGTELSPAFLDYIALGHRKVGQVMTEVVITAAPTTPLATLAELLDTHRIKRLPIVQDGKLVGVVSRADLVRAIARMPTTLDMAS